jgi:hypothetical protein
MRTASKWIAQIAWFDVIDPEQPLNGTNHTYDGFLAVTFHELESIITPFER